MSASVVVAEYDAKLVTAEAAEVPHNIQEAAVQEARNSGAAPVCGGVAAGAGRLCGADGWFRELPADGGPGLRGPPGGPLLLAGGALLLR
ncbi:unnamed protein product [Ixodes pacificus]